MAEGTEPVELTGKNALTPAEAEALSLCVQFAAKKSDWGLWGLWEQAATAKAKVDVARGRSDRGSDD